MKGSIEDLADIANKTRPDDTRSIADKVSAVPPPVQDLVIVSFLKGRAIIYPVDLLPSPSPEAQAAYFAETAKYAIFPKVYLDVLKSKEVWSTTYPALAPLFENDLARVEVGKRHGVFGNKQPNLILTDKEQTRFC